MCFLGALGPLGPRFTEPGAMAQAVGTEGKAEPLLVEAAQVSRSLTTLTVSGLCLKKAGVSGECHGEQGKATGMRRLLSLSSILVIYYLMRRALLNWIKLGCGKFLSYGDWFLF